MTFIDPRTPESIADITKQDLEDSYLAAARRNRNAANTVLENILRRRKALTVAERELIHGEWCLLRHEQETIAKGFLMLKEANEWLVSQLKQSADHLSLAVKHYESSQQKGGE